MDKLTIYHGAYYCKKNQRLLYNLCSAAYNIWSRAFATLYYLFVGKMFKTENIDKLCTT